MIADGVIGGRHAQARSGTSEKATEHDKILGGGIVIPRTQEMVKAKAAGNRGKGTDQMGVYIDRLIVNITKAGSGFLVTVRWRSVARSDVEIVLLPGRNLVPQDGEGTLDFCLDLVDVCFDSFGQTCRPILIIILPPSAHCRR